MSHPGSPLTRFFDRVVRRSFGDLALRDDPAADYLSDLLTRFARTVRERELRRHIGDYTLFRPEHELPDLPFFRQLITAW